MQRRLLPFGLLSMIYTMNFAKFTSNQPILEKYWHLLVIGRPVVKKKHYLFGQCLFVFFFGGGWEGGERGLACVSDLWQFFMVFLFTFSGLKRLPKSTLCFLEGGPLIDMQFIIGFVLWLMLTYLGEKEREVWIEVK